MPNAPCRIALLGFGTVGSAVARRLTAPDPVHNLILTHVFDRRQEAKRAAFEQNLENLANPANPANLANLASPGNPANPRTLWTADIDQILASDADIVVEALGGVQPAAGWIRAALLAGKSVVTSNKQAIAHEGPALRALASRQGRQIRFEAAVGGAMPIVRTLAGGLAGDRVRSIAGILNGTTNAVLSRVEATGCTVAEALDAARARGWAERDASLDLDGTDARAKLAILCALAFGLRVSPDEIEARPAQGLTPADFDAARRRGGTIRQIARAACDGPTRALTAWVAPAFVPRGSFFARTAGAGNAAIVSAEFAGIVQMAGVGAGGDPTAVTILSDILAIARDPAALVPPPELARTSRIEGLGGMAGPVVDGSWNVELHADAV